MDDMTQEEIDALELAEQDALDRIAAFQEFADAVGVPVELVNRLFGR